MDNCVFCSIVEKNIPHHEIIWSDDDHIAFLSLNPSRDGHTLIIPKKHSARITDMPEAEYLKLWAASRTVSRLLMQSLECELIGMVSEGKSVPHTHIHLIPLKKGEELATFHTEDRTQEELATIAKNIRGEI